jgi:hypothetical protein
MTKPVIHAASASPVTLDAAQTLMWTHFKANKSLLVDEIKMFRDQILAELMSGKSVDDAFSKFVRPPEPLGARRKAKSS